MLHMIVGPMFSGKTSAMLSKLERVQLAKQDVILITKDTRNENVETHAGMKFKGSVVNSIEECINIIEEANCVISAVGIDEAQFFDVDELYDFVTKYYKKINIIAAGLDSDFRRFPFEWVETLIPHANSIVKLTAVCPVCGQDAIYTKRLIENKERILEGNEEAYISVCSEHF